MMKRKLALFLAAVMTVAAMPTTLFAATSENRLTKSAMNVPDYTLFYESDVAGSSGGTVTGNSDEIEYWFDGSNLIIELQDPVTEGLVRGTGVFKLTLDNADWFFRAREAGTAVALPASVEATTVTVGGTPTNVAARLAEIYPNIIGGSTGAYTAVSKTDMSDMKGTGLPEDATGLISTFNQAIGVYNDGKYFRLPSATTDPSGLEVPYMMDISMADESTATVVLLADAAAKKRIIIPIVALTTEESAEVRLNITDSASSISRGSYLVATGRTGRTTTRAVGTVTSRTDFNLKDIVISEQRFGSIKTGAQFELSAPSGYYFDTTSTEVYTQLGLQWGFGPGSGVLDTDYTIAYRRRNNRDDRSTVIVTLTTLKPSTNLAGSVFLSNLLLIADDVDATPVTGKQLSLTIKDTAASNSNKSFTDESFVVATVSDYIVSMKRVTDTIPELVSGRLDSYVTVTDGVYESAVSITDENHKAAVVRVEETIANAWWAERATEFRLPENVRILQAEFTNLTNLSTASVKNLTSTTRSEPSGTFYNTGSRENSVITIKDNSLIVSRLAVADTAKKARFDLSLWLNIDVAFEGDIDLSLSGSAVTNEEDVSTVTIATAISPVEVITKVSDIKVGYQYISVADFEIVETKAGNLQQGETVYVSVTDEISVDMNIAKGFNAQVTDGDLKISNVIVRSALGSTGEEIDGQVKFDIDRESGTASTITFSNVQVKVDSNVPQSNLSINNERGINLVVWGSAIAQNYEGLTASIRNNIDTDSRLSTRDFFGTPGIRAKYINIGGSASGGNSNISNVVQVSIGNPVIQVGEEQYTMPVAAYVSTASNSTMVPVRFVSYALGLSESNVIWDAANSTVTVDAGTRIIQFQVGNTNYLVNGISVPMVSPDGLPVSTEIRDERAFIPFRALGEAFGINVTWDSATSTATYNAPIVQ